MPTTEAGKRWMQTPAAQIVTGMADAIAAIEAEAVAAERARIRAAVDEAEPRYEPSAAPPWYYDGWYEARDAVLAIVNREEA